MAITLLSRWHEFFGYKPANKSAKERKQNWNLWKKYAEGKSSLSYWTDSSESCTGCIYKNNDWCNLQELPCTVNPILTIQFGIKGIACYGAGFNDGKPKQLELDLQTENLPF